MKPAVLRGRENTTLGAVAAISEGRCAVALSRGGAAKTYRYKDPNEDAAAFAEGEGGILIAVADGHGGCGASETAINRLVEQNARPWTARSAPGLDALWPAAARSAIVDVNDAILRFAARWSDDWSRTTLTFAVLRPDDDLFAFGSMGDSHAFRVENDTATDLAHDPSIPNAFLGSPQESPETLSEGSVVGVASLAGVRAVVLVTDGLSETHIGVEVPEAAVIEAVDGARDAEHDLRPLRVARATVEAALCAHRRNRAGDNVASAIAWLEP